MPRDALRQLHLFFDWNDTANAMTLEALRAIPEPPPRSARWFAHIVGTERLWFSRIRHDGDAVAVWPDLSLEACSDVRTELRAAWRSLFQELGAEDLTRRVEYVNSKSEKWHNTVGDMLLQIVFHGVHHRAQIASDLREAGHEPPYVDYIELVRRGAIG